MMRVNFRRDTLSAEKKRDLLRCDLTADLRKHGVGIASYEPHRTHYNYQDHGQHHSILSYVLTALVIPKTIYCSNHNHAPSTNAQGYTPTWLAVVCFNVAVTSGRIQWHGCDPSIALLC